MRVLTWNVNGRVPAPAWTYIRDYLEPDVAFLQEAQRQEKPQGVKEWVWAAIGENSRFAEKSNYRWASGIAAWSGHLEELSFDELGPGWVVGARFSAGDRTLTLINMHSEYGEGLYATTSLNRAVDAIREYLSGPDVIFGGDLNVDPLWDDVHGTKRHREVLRRLTDLGLFHVNSLLPAGTRTNRVSKRPYQIDHLFVSESLHEAVVDIRVIVGSSVARLSDHYPLVLDLDLAGVRP